MKKILFSLSTVALFLILINSASFAKDYSIEPRLKPNGKKFRIIYLQGGEYYEYDLVFKAVIHELQNLGWAEKRTLPDEISKNAESLYRYLSRKDGWSKYIDFPEDGFYDNEWKDEFRSKTMQDIMKRDDIDMIFAYGTWAGQDMKKMPPEYDTVPIVVMDVSDPLRSEIVDSNTDSGRDNLTARVDPLRYQRQVALFHGIIGFKKLGMAFEDTVEGRSYSAISDVEKVAGQNGFEIITEKHPGYVENREKAVEWILESCRKLSKKVDAFYVTQQLAVDEESLPKILSILNAQKIPTFSQAGSTEVQRGVLLSIANAGFKYVADYHANKIARILNGAKPRDLPILFEDPAKIAINIKTAKEIGFDPPVDIIGAADEIYTE